MIKIVSQSATNQYDSQGRAITTWDAKKCSWIINKEFESEEIDWWGNDNDFPAGCTEEHFQKHNPNWDKNPDITVTWVWETKETCIKAFGQPYSFGQKSNYWDKMKYPYTATRNWGYLEYDEKQAIESLGKYCSFNAHADTTTVYYNGKIIHQGKLI